jgi:DNA-binding beta-propeller fold protein YncE
MGPGRGRRGLAVMVALGVLAGMTAVAAATAVHSSSPTTAADAAGPNASRLLALTGDGSGVQATAGSKAAVVQADVNVGHSPQLGSEPQTPQGWELRPAGKQVQVLRFPLGLASAAGGSKIIVSSDSGGVQGLTVIDAASLAAVPIPAANLFMGVAATPDGRIFASGGNADRVFRWQLAGPVAVPLDLTEAQPLPIHNALNGLLPRVGLPSVLPVGDGIGVPGYPGGMVLDGSILYVAGTLSEPSTAAQPCPAGQSACARVAVIDTTSGKVLTRVPVGLDAFGLAIDSVRHRLYVSNWADEAGRGGTNGGTVSVLDVTDPTHAREIATVGVGHHPSALQLSKDRSTLFVADTNDDTIHVLDVHGNGATVKTVESVRPVVGTPVGAHPDAFALSPDGDTLFVAMAGLNAVELRDGKTGAPVAGKPVYIPTGWYPSALTITGTSGHYRLWVVNTKGTGPGPGLNGSVFFQGTKTGGTISAIDLPVSLSQINSWTSQVRENDQLDRVPTDACTPAAGITVSEVLCPPAGQSSPIDHVVYIVTENKTFDQYFGDINLTGGSGYDAFPGFVLYGQPVTPNHHALATRYSLGDRFFSDAEVSVTGHSYTSGAEATDHNEITWQSDYDQGIRGNKSGGDPLRPSISGPAGGQIQAAEDQLQDPQGGYIFEAFRKAGATPPSDNPGKVSMAIYGEHTAITSGNMDAYKAPHWKDGDIQYFDVCRAEQFITGSSPKGPIPDSLKPPDVPIPALGTASAADCEGRTLPGQFNLAHWAAVQKATGRDVMPNFIYMSLPDNHTLGANVGSPTPASMVADNDIAIGMIVDALSHSPFWKHTAVFVTEDDTQLAADHVSSLRDYLQVISPWAKPGPNHQWGSMGSLLRTIETIFKVPPFSLNDKVAIPQHGAFLTKLTDTPDLAPYELVHTVVPFALNQPGLPGQLLSQAMDFSTVDKIDEGTLNLILYAIGKGMTLDQAAAFLANPSGP